MRVQVQKHRQESSPEAAADSEENHEKNRVWIRQWLQDAYLAFPPESQELKGQRFTNMEETTRLSIDWLLNWKSDARRHEACPSEHRAYFVDTIADTLAHTGYYSKRNKAILALECFFESGAHSNIPAKSRGMWLKISWTEGYAYWSFLGKPELREWNNWWWNYDAWAEELMVRFSRDYQKSVQVRNEQRMQQRTTTEQAKEAKAPGVRGLEDFVSMLDSPVQKSSVEKFEATATGGQLSSLLESTNREEALFSTSLTSTSPSLTTASPSFAEISKSREASLARTNAGGSKNDSDHDTSTHFARTNMPDTGPAITPQWSVSRVVTVLAFFTAFIFGIGAWAGQSYANSLTESNNDMSLYTMCADHQELGNTPRCRAILASTLHEFNITKRQAASDIATYPSSLNTNMHFVVTSSGEASQTSGSTFRQSFVIFSSLVGLLLVLGVSCVVISPKSRYARQLITSAYFAPFWYLVGLM